MRIALLYTTFPKASETFLQREAAAWIAAGHDVEIFSIWGGCGETFAGKEIHRFSFLGLLCAIAKAFGLLFIRPSVWALAKPVRWAGWMNYFENLIGLAAGIFWVERLGKFDGVHAQWGTAPAMAALAAQKINLKIRFSMGLHAYDLYEQGGDGWLPLKISAAKAIFSSNLQAQQEILRRYPTAIDKPYLVRRGLPAEYFASLEKKEIPTVLQFITIGRLVEKKGFEKFIGLMAELKNRNIKFEAKIIGEGELREKLEAQISKLNLKDVCMLCGWRSPGEVRQQLRAATFFLFTGGVAASGDRDGFPNVIGEGFAAGAVVMTAGQPQTGVGEGVINNETGILLEKFDVARGADEIQKLSNDSQKYERLRQNAYRWAVENFDAQKNAAKSWQIFEKLFG